jgi:hypothetical protein
VNDGLTQPVFDWLVEVLGSVRQQDPAYKRLIWARRDDLGALWVRDSLDERLWAVYTTSGAATASVMLPAGVKPLHIGRAFVLGIVYDSLGVEELRIYSLDRDASHLDLAIGTPTQLPVDSAILAAFPTLLMAQEAYYAGHARYARDADSVAMTSPFPARLFLLDGDARHWAGIAVNPKSGATCGLSVGWPAPLGWIEGAPKCGR